MMKENGEPSVAASNIEQGKAVLCLSGRVGVSGFTFLKESLGLLLPADCQRCPSASRGRGPQRRGRGEDGLGAKKIGLRSQTYLFRMSS